MSKIIRIGTRDSDLALWQAKTVQSQLEHLGHKTVLVPVKSTGDLVLNKPIYEAVLYSSLILVISLIAIWRSNREVLFLYF